MTTKTYNFHPELLKSIEKDNLIIFVGAGLSYNLKNEKGEIIGGWGKLVEQILINLKENGHSVDHFLGLIGKCEPIKILDLIECDTKLPKSEMIDFTRDFLELHKDNDYSLHKDLYKLSRKLITTNYDEAFENAVIELKRNTAFKGKNYELTKHKESENPLLFKLHGCVNHADSMILFPSSYKSLYESELRDAKHVLSVLRNIVYTKTILFIGCGMGDYQINNIFSYVKELQGDYNQKHFIITTKPLYNSLNFLEPINIDDHSETSMVINQLLKEKENLTSKKTLELAELEQQLSETKQQISRLEEKIESVQTESERKDELLKIESLKYFIRGLSFQIINKYDEASKLYELSVILNPNNTDSLINWGIALTSIARINNDEKIFLKAIEKIRNSIEINPTDDYAFFGLGNALTHLGILTSDISLLLEADKTYKKVLEINPENEVIYNNWGNALSELGDIKKDDNLLVIACEKFEKVPNSSSEYFISLYNYGNTLTKIAMSKNDNKLFLRANEKYSQASKIEFLDFPLLYNWGYMLATYGYLNRDAKSIIEACENFKKAEKINNKNVNLLSSWGCALMNLGNLEKNVNFLEEACEKFEEASSIDNKNFGILFYWGNTLTNMAVMKNKKELFFVASKKFEKAHKINSTNKDLYNNWGTILLNLSRIGNDENLFLLAIEKLEKAYNLGANPYHLACAYALKIKKDKALHYLEICLKNHQTSAYHVENDIDWKYLKNDSNFVALLNKYKY